MRFAIAKRVIVIVVTLCACAGFGSYTRAVEETRAGLVGLSGRDLRECLGVPSDFVIDGDVEQQSYRFEHDDELETVYGAGGSRGVLIGSRTPGDRSYDPHGFPVIDRDPSYCQLDFELSKGRVTRVSAQGRTPEGMNADASCLLRAQPCLSYVDEEDVEATE
jgi:hypothetical protein